MRATNRFEAYAQAPPSDAEHIQRGEAIERTQEAARRSQEPSEPPLPKHTLRPPLHITPAPPRLQCCRLNADGAQCQRTPTERLTTDAPLCRQHARETRAMEGPREPAPPSTPPPAPAPAPERETRKLASPEHLQGALVDLLGAYPVFAVLDGVWKAHAAVCASRKATA